jgi:hypothetical protein
MPGMRLDETRKEIFHFCFSQFGRHCSDCAETRRRLWPGVWLPLKPVKFNKCNDGDRTRAFNLVSLLLPPAQRATARKNPTGLVSGSWNVQTNPGEFVLILVQSPLVKSLVHCITASVRSPVVVENWRVAGST